MYLYYTQGNKNEFHFYRCPSCTIVSYEGDCSHDQHKYELSLLNAEKIIKMRKHAEQTYAFIRRSVPEKKGTMIDVGCGSGELIVIAHQDGWVVKGLELSSVYVDYIKKHHAITVIQEDFFNFRDSDSVVYDVVVMRHVLEHLQYPILALFKIKSLLAPDGIVVLEFPNIDAPELRLKRFLHRTGLHKKRYPEDYKPGHCTEFCRDSFHYLLEKTGFDLIIWQTYASRYPANFIYNRIPWGNKVRTIIKNKTY